MDGLAELPATLPGGVSKVYLYQYVAMFEWATTSSG